MVLPCVDLARRAIGCSCPAADPVRAVNFDCLLPKFSSPSSFGMSLATKSVGLPFSVPSLTPIMRMFCLLERETKSSSLSLSDRAVSSHLVHRSSKALIRVSCSFSPLSLEVTLSSISAIVCFRSTRDILECVKPFVDILTQLINGRHDVCRSWCLTQRCIVCVLTTSFFHVVATSISLTVSTFDLLLLLLIFGSFAFITSPHRSVKRL